MSENDWVISSREHLFKKIRFFQINPVSSWVDSLLAAIC